MRIQSSHILIVLILSLFLSPLIAQDQDRRPPIQSFTLHTFTPAFILAHPIPIRAKRINLKGALIQLNDFGSADIAYLSVPVRQPLGGLILIHEWWGLNDHIKHTADRLADEGFLCIAVDLFNGKVTHDPTLAAQYMQSLNERSALKTIRAAERFLRESPRFRVSKTATIGWCMGGGLSLQAAIHIPTLDAAVIYYGPVETDPRRIRLISAPILAHFANNDPWVSPESARTFIQHMRTARKKIEAHFYDAPHAFANPSNPQHNPTLTRLTWERTLTFLHKEFSTPPKSTPRNSSPSPQKKRSKSL
ncbi:MAG: dienelactone hydrolase family protein [Methylacidiphilales bacterium]|nr:dienelactone hydrolase family protein [Candidatus Methylacidiphilales bacterium]MDW8349164.1 dienelactone hydrolase family protein [Verrucomicrobiae bacterium]